MAHLIIRLESGERFYARLDPRQKVVNLGSGGWAENVHVSIAHHSVAELHASLEAIPGGYQLVDRSGGRSWARGKPLSAITLVDRLDLKLGDVYVAFFESDVEADPETAAGLADEGLPDRLWLAITEPGRREPRRVPLEPGAELRLGSAEDADVRLPHPTVSRAHARLSREAARLCLRDDSRNGTFVNGVPIQACTLPLDMPVRIGPYELRAVAEPQARPGLTEFHGLFTASESMRAVFELITRLAQQGDRSIVVHGESGTGKEAVAHALHALGPRAAGPFVALSCADFADQLLEAELFGAVKGAYTGSVLDRAGVFVQADGGTLFLDEIGELSPLAQTKLLRAIQEKTVRPLGASASVQVDVRVVVATHRDLLQEVEAKRFREDLFYRLFVLSVEVPPLRERGDDAVLLFQHFMRLALPHASVPTPSPAALQRLRDHPWPGNVRELKNTAERVAFTVGTAGPFEPEALQLRKPREPKAHTDGDIHARGRDLDSVEQQAIALAMRDHRGNRTSAAKQLAISPTTLLKKLVEYGLEKEGKG